MNKLIEEIWEETTKTCIPREGDYSCVSKENIQKFAELLIKECAMVANKAENNDSEFRCMYNVVVEHFEIKE